ncbi:MAG: carboxymuconolactone decarboxylase family protein [Proteobacteria bacterium]|nr:carboxymuconolactone decarboxylase family protein [Pseudomonadota bacterium]
MSDKRISIPQAAPKGYATLVAVHTYLEGSGLPHELMELVKIRASQINGCAFCLDMHSKDARKHGISQQRLDVLAGWRDSPAFSDAERAALGWTESLTSIALTNAPDADYQPLEKHFSPKEIADLTMLVGMINLWNRIGVGMRNQHPLDRHEPAHAAA